MRSLHKLSDTTIRTFKTNETVRLSDGGGLHLTCHPTGRKVWTFAFRDLAGKQKSVTLGEYPGCSLAEARERAATARDDAKQGLPPGGSRRRDDTFEAWIERTLEEKARLKRGGAPRTIKRIRQALKQVFERLGAVPISAITVPLLAEVLKSTPSAESRVVAHGFLRDVFRKAVISRVAKMNVAGALDGEFTSERGEGFKALLDWNELGKLVLAMRTYPSRWSVDIAMEIGMRQALRPGEVRHIEWHDLDLDAATLWIPPEKAKTREGRKVFLSPQTVELFRCLKQRQRFTSTWCFPAANGKAGPICEMSAARAIKVIGFKGRVHNHGLRKSFRTLAAESRLFNEDVLELCIGHVRRGVLGIYNLALLEQEQRKAFDWWNARLDEMAAKMGND